MVLFKIRVDVCFPVELLDDEVEVLVLLLGHVLDEQRTGHFATFYERLVHAEDIGSPLRLVGAERTRRVQDAWSDEPTAAGFQAKSLRQVEDAVVALVPVLQA